MSAVVLGGGLLALFATGYTFLAIPGKESARTSEGIDLGDAIQVEYAWGRSVEWAVKDSNLRPWD